MWARYDRVRMTQFNDSIQNERNFHIDEYGLLPASDENLPLTLLIHSHCISDLPAPRWYVNKLPQSLAHCHASVVWWATRIKTPCKVSRMNPWRSVQWAFDLTTRPQELHTGWWSSLGPVLLMQSEPVASILTNACRAFKWKLHCHWLIGMAPILLTIFWLNSKLDQVLWFKMYSTNPKETLHMSRQCKFHDVCRISLWWVEHVLNYNTPKVALHFEFDQNMLVGQGQGPTSVRYQNWTHQLLRYVAKNFKSVVMCYILSPQALPEKLLSGQFHNT